MKKTLNINLSGIVFNIDDDAYNLLREYLDNLRHIFNNGEDDANEILNDIEGRICELLSEEICNDRQVVCIEHIQNIISRIGHPNEFGETEPNDNSDNTESEPKSMATKPKRRLFRNPHNKIVGGVCSGIATYLDVDVTWVRLLFIGLAFLTLTTILVAYLVLLIVVPEAKTAADILEMNGEEQTIKNIGKTVTDTYENVNRKAQPYIEQAKGGSLFKRIANGVVNIFSFIAKAVVMALGIVAIPIVIALALAFVVILLILISFGIAALTTGWIPFTEMIGLPPSPDYYELIWSLVLALGIIMSIGLPLIILIFSVFKSSEKVKPLSRNMRMTLIIMWVIGIIASSVSICFLNTF